MKLLVVGFNARPIANSAVRAGHEIGVIDYFGDYDLLKLTKNCFSVLRQKPGLVLHRPLHRRPAEYLYFLAEIMSDEQGDFDGIILGSAFDRYPELVKQFKDIGPRVYANDSKKFALTRQKHKINEIAKKSGFEIPTLDSTETIQELIEFAKNSTFPLVTRGDGGGGGAGIKLWKNLTELKDYFVSKDRADEKIIWIQEHIEGIDASSTVNCLKKEVQLISINRQLIGDKNLRAPSEFAYSGNIIPLNYQSHKENSSLEERHLESIRKLFLNLQLRGSNGVDFVIKDEKLFFMEVNPRFQGSIECVQYATGHNLVKLHLDAFHNVKHELPEKPNYKQSSVKGILFSDSEQPFPVKGYPKNEWVVDRTHKEVLLEKTDPFCSIVLPCKDSEKGYKEVCEIAEKITEMNKINVQ
ncbi:MAG: ATP-grasp domain-containing protein [Candidatus Heimdallarchaeota archaeon]|nr:ATP-grasp domain-containing protein [Candidatus Heimdallarchaeota archaeon]MBY8995377.1 ATP-grasp domain-containing protein [Candidatus Heimdallarchaeota archaeon]